MVKFMAFQTTCTSVITEKKTPANAIAKTTMAAGPTGDTWHLPTKPKTPRPAATAHGGTLCIRQGGDEKRNDEDTWGMPPCGEHICGTPVSGH